jgi:HTH-type transcriptional regulator, sugar sensing transcriptional regulator
MPECRKGRIDSSFEIWFLEFKEIMPSLEQSLQSAGLSEKEAKVYLAALELGTAGAVQIARKSGISRGTTYLIAENLMLRGLMSSIERDGHTLFSSEPPGQLLARVENESRTVEERKRSLAAALPELEALVKAGGTPRPSVRYYEGLQGLEAMREILYKNRRFEILNAANVNISEEFLPRENLEAHRRMLKLYDIRGRLLYTCSDKLHEELFAAAPTDSLWQRRRLPADRFPFHGEVVIFGDHVAFISYAGRVSGALIEHAHFALSMKTIFEMAWKEAEKNVLK